MYDSQLLNNPLGINVSTDPRCSWLHEIWEVYESESNSIQGLSCVQARN